MLQFDLNVEIEIILIISLNGSDNYYEVFSLKVGMFTTLKCSFQTVLLC